MYDFIVNIDAEIERQRSIEFCGPYGPRDEREPFGYTDAEMEMYEEIDRRNREYCESLEDNSKDKDKKEDSPTDDDGMPF